MAKGNVRGRSETEPRVRRGYFECRYGQLHLHNAIPAGGGFDEGTALICVHPSPRSGRVFQRLLTALGRDRSVYAPDLPGYGESDPPPAAPSIADYASAIVDFCDTMRLRQVDVLGFQNGSLVAAEVALARPAVVRRVVLASVPVPTEADRAAFRRSPWPSQPLEDGTHLLRDWRRTLETNRAALTLEALNRIFADELYNGPNAWWGIKAALDHATLDRLMLVTQPTLIVRCRDEFSDATRRAHEANPKMRLVELTESGSELFERVPEPLVSTLREFLRT
jgi:pimeloyl-ACP methyl ester carboxylesterase